MALPALLAPAGAAVAKAFDLVDDFFDTEGEKADRVVTREEIAARRRVAELELENAGLRTQAAIAEAQSRAIAARAQSRSWLQRNLFPFSALAYIGFIGAEIVGYAVNPIPLEAIAVLLVIAGGGVIDWRLLRWFQKRAAVRNPTA